MTKAVKIKCEDCPDSFLWTPYRTYAKRPRFCTTFRYRRSTSHTRPYLAIGDRKKPKTPTGDPRIRPASPEL